MLHQVVIQQHLMVVVILVNLLIMKPVRYPYVNNPLGFKLPEVKPVVHPIIYQWDDLPEDQKEELQTIKMKIRIIFRQHRQLALIRIKNRLMKWYKIKVNKNQKSKKQMKLKNQKKTN